ncbi:MAG TPA: hypothetical protein PKE56_18320, partial [Acidimicrobiales bacterium]|nr:hypothetical protein [Acidimicrobiales bacterium]
AEPASDKPGEAPYFEAKVSPIGGDIDSAGGRIMVWPDRLEVIDATGRLDGRMPIDTIAKVKVTKRLTSVTVKITGSTHRRLTIKGVKPADATGLRHALADLRTPNPDGSRGVPTADASASSPTRTSTIVVLVCEGPEPKPRPHPRTCPPPSPPTDRYQLGRLLRSE